MINIFLCPINYSYRKYESQHSQGFAGFLFLVTKCMQFIHALFVGFMQYSPVEYTQVEPTTDRTLC